LCGQRPWAVNRFTAAATVNRNSLPNLAEEDRRIDEAGAEALVQIAEPVNKFLGYVCRLV
jgi:hypothetical protein